MTDPSKPPPALIRALSTPLVEERDLDFAVPLQKRIKRDDRNSLIAGILWRVLIVASVALLIAAGAVGAFYLTRLGLKAIVGV